ncbi:transcriptional regulator [Salmonella enterica subsp. arizonae]|nr:transcriptional regulator [Salmonella enterica subsp. arizonae]
MWSEYSLEVVDAVARNGSFSAAAQELHRVPSAVSYTVRQLEEWLAVPLFLRRHRDVELTPAGVWFLKEGRSVIKKMQITRQQCQQIANGWRGQLAIAVDNIVRPERTRQMIVDSIVILTMWNCWFFRKCLTVSGTRSPMGGSNWPLERRKRFR